QIERVRGEPLASTLRRLEAVQREARRRLRVRDAFASEDDGARRDPRDEVLTHGHAALETWFDSRVTAALRASALPGDTDASVSSEMLESATMFPANCALSSSVAELPT